MKLLSRLLSLLFPVRDSYAQVERLTEDEALCLLSPMTLPDGTVALLSYRNPVVRSLVLEAKFHASEKAQDLLGAILAEHLLGHFGEDEPLGNARYALLPVPLGRKRLKERGYNQAERIAAAAGKRIGMPVEQVLIRVKETVAQTSLPKEKRQRNTQGAFRAEGARADTTYILVDDVVTTGATMQDAARTLDTAAFRIALAH